MAVSFIGGDTGVPGENYRAAASQWQTLLHKVVSSTPHISFPQILKSLKQKVHYMYLQIGVNGKLLSYGLYVRYRVSYKVRFYRYVYYRKADIKDNQSFRSAVPTLQHLIFT
jgi:hypothetical protein